MSVHTVTGRVTCLARVTMRNARPAYTMIDGPQEGITFYASDDPTTLDEEAHVIYHPDDQYARRATVGEWFTAEILDAMQEADEITVNLQIDEYIEAMRTIAADATRRADTAERNRS